MAKSGKAIRKYQLIDKANRGVFTVVAVAVFLISFGLVAVIFMFNKMTFNANVISEKNKTYDVLVQNNKNMESLAQEFQALQTNDALRSIKVSDDDDAVKVVFDALPGTGNSTALGASLKDKLLSVPGVRIEHLTVEGTPEEVAPDELEEGLGEIDDSIGHYIVFDFKVIGEVSELSTVLRNLEKSIRPIVASNVQFEVSTSEDQSSLTVRGYSFYEPMIDAKLGTKTIKAGDK